MTDAIQKAQAALKNKVNGDVGEELVASGSTLTRVQTEHITAVFCQIKRVKKDILDAVVEECGIDSDGLLYKWTVNSKEGPKNIEGPSIKLAMILAREWGNSATDCQIVGESATHWIFRGVFIDLEKGSTTPRLYRQRKPFAGKGKMDRDRQEDIDFQIGQSKAIRNAVVNALPAWLLKAASRSAKESMVANISKEIDATSKIQMSFSKWNVTLPMLEAKIGKASGEWTNEDIVELRSLYTAIKDGATNPADEFNWNIDGE